MEDTEPLAAGDSGLRLAVVPEPFARSARAGSFDHTDMSKADTTSESHLFEVLPGSPGVGPYPEQFSHTGHGTHSEGLVVRFRPPSGPSWIGNFVGFGTGYNAALLHPDGRTVVVVSRGQAYHVDPATRALLRHFGGEIRDVVHDATSGLLIFSDGIRLWA